MHFTDTCVLGGHCVGVYCCDRRGENSRFPEIPVPRCPLPAVTCACTELQKIEQERASHEQRQQASPGEPDNERAEARASLHGSDAGDRACINSERGWTHDASLVKDQLPLQDLR